MPFADQGGGYDNPALVVPPMQGPGLGMTPDDLNRLKIGLAQQAARRIGVGQAPPAPVAGLAPGLAAPTGMGGMVADQVMAAMKNGQDANAVLGKMAASQPVPALTAEAFLAGPGAAPQAAPPPSPHGDWQTALYQSLATGLAPPGQRNLPGAQGTAMHEMVLPDGSRQAMPLDRTGAAYDPRSPVQLQQASDMDARAKGQLPSFAGFMADNLQQSDPMTRALAQNPDYQAKMMPLYMGQKQMENDLIAKAAEERGKLIGTAAKLQETSIAHQGLESKDLAMAKNNIYLQAKERAEKMPGVTPEQADQIALKAAQDFVNSTQAVQALKQGGQVPAGQAPAAGAGAAGGVAAKVAAAQAAPDIANPAVQQVLEPTRNIVVNGQLNVPNLLQQYKGQWGNMNEQQKAGLAQLLKSQSGGYADVNKALTDQLANHMFETGTPEFQGYRLANRTPSMLDKLLGSGMNTPYTLSAPGGQELGMKSIFGGRQVMPTTQGTKNRMKQEMSLLTELLGHTLQNQ